jgi:hypothetical protein
MGVNVDGMHMGEVWVYGSLVDLVSMKKAMPNVKWFVTGCSEEIWRSHIKPNFKQTSHLILTRRFFLTLI